MQIGLKLKIKHSRNSKNNASQNKKSIKTTIATLMLCIFLVFGCADTCLSIIVIESSNNNKVDIKIKNSETPVDTLATDETTAISENKY